MLPREMLPCFFLGRFFSGCVFLGTELMNVLLQEHIYIKYQVILNMSFPGLSFCRISTGSATHSLKMLRFLVNIQCKADIDDLDPWLL